MDRSDAGGDAGSALLVFIAGQDAFDRHDFPARVDTFEPEPHERQLEPAGRIAEDARRSVAVASTSARSKMNGPSAFNV